jgi:hypothetical protein
MIDDYGVMLAMLGHPVHGPCIDFFCLRHGLDQSNLTLLALIWHFKSLKKRTDDKKNRLGVYVDAKTLTNSRSKWSYPRRGLFVILLFLAILALVAVVNNETIL